MNGTEAIVLNPAASPPHERDAAASAVLDEDGLAEARAAITRWPDYRPTPLRSLDGLARQAGVASLHYKDEGERFGLGSFKALGGAYAVECLIAGHADPAAVTVCCATDGNHGRSVAWGARTFGCRAVIFVHATVSDGRVAAIERYGARVVRTAGNYDESVREAQRVADERGWYVVSDTAWPGYEAVPTRVMQGYELMALEALEQLPAPPTHVFLQTGVGGMAAAVAACLTRRADGPRPRFVLADPERSACWVESLRAGEPVRIDGELDTLMAGLACGEVSPLAWRVLRTLADAAVAVPDAAATGLMRRLARPTLAGDARGDVATDGGEDEPIVAGESAVAGLAALLALAPGSVARETLGLDAHSRVLVFGTESDTDPELYERIVGRSSDDVRAGRTADGER